MHRHSVRCDAREGMLGVVGGRVVRVGHDRLLIWGKELVRVHEPERPFRTRFVRASGLEALTGPSMDHREVAMTTKTAEKKAQSIAKMEENLIKAKAKLEQAKIETSELDHLVGQTGYWSVTKDATVEVEITGIGVKVYGKRMLVVSPIAGSGKVQVSQEKVKLA